MFFSSGISVFLILSPIYWIKVDWLMPFYITGVVLAGEFFSRRMMIAQFLISIIIHISLLIEICLYVVPIRSDDTWAGWQQLDQQVEQAKKKYPSAFVFSADGYKTTSILNLYGHSFTYGQNVIGQRALHYDFIGTGLSTLKDRNAIHIDSQPAFDDLDRGAGSEGIGWLF